MNDLAQNFRQPKIFRWRKNSEANTYFRHWSKAFKIINALLFDTCWPIGTSICKTITKGCRLTCPFNSGCQYFWRWQRQEKLDFQFWHGKTYVIELFRAPTSVSPILSNRWKNIEWLILFFCRKSFAGKFLHKKWETYWLLSFWSVFRPPDILFSTFRSKLEYQKRRF